MYIKKTWRAGRTVEVKKTYSARFGRKLPRAGNIMETTKAQERVNRRNAEGELRRILNENFKPGDWHLVFTFPMKIPPTPAEAKAAWTVFLRKLRALYKKQGVELRYVHVCEYAHTRIHFHAVMTKLPEGLEPVKQIWKEVLAARFYTVEERARREPLHLRLLLSELDESGNYSKLSSYLIKETEKTRKMPDAVNRRRYCCSKNIVHPKPVIEIISARDWRKDPPQRRGYYIDKRESYNGTSEENGLPMQVTIYVALDRGVRMRN